MSNTARISIAKALAEKLKSIDGTTGWNTNIFNNAFSKLKFWDEVNDFPCIYMSIGGETREYLPGGFKWGFLSIALKAYVRSEDPPADLELLIQDIEKVIDNNRQLAYDTNPNHITTEILINSIVTDEGLLEPYGVGEINITVQYPVL